MNARDAWRATLGQLQIELNRSTYDTWLRHAELLGYEDGCFIVTVPNAYAKDWIERHLLQAIKEKISRLYQQESDVQVVVWDPVDEVKEEEVPLLDYPNQAFAEEIANSLNPTYTFDTFVIGESNRYAALLAQAIVDSPIGKYSPVLFYGDMGMGKTHLLQAITRAMLDKGHKAIYITAENFTTELITAIRNRDNSAFRDKYRTADAVIFDDIQFVEGKDSPQNEIVAIWDTLRNRQKTMIFASDRLPRDMVKICKDVRSRFQAGPIAHIDAPDFQLRLDIIEARSRDRGLFLPQSVGHMIAREIQGSPRDLESAIDQLHTFTHLTGQSIDQAASMVFRTLGSSLETSHHRDHNHTSVELESVLEAVAAYYHISVSDLSGRKRTKVIAQARQLAMYIAREATTASLPQIGDAIGRDHSTVLHGCARVAAMIEEDPTIAKDVHQIRIQLGKHIAVTV
jgi:chromosomal replication initiator protein